MLIVKCYYNDDDFIKQQNFYKEKFDEQYSLNEYDGWHGTVNDLITMATDISHDISCIDDDKINTIFVLWMIIRYVIKLDAYHYFEICHN
ncbi:MAG TPA: hypothetical protein VLG50_07755 [Candidatus Saccharimonadales bacterium]|nr:hypothetical protein [Candidatus Saccharimonadales bacterium]